MKNAPTKITREDAQAEYERARRYASIVTGLVDPDAYEGLQLTKLKEATKIVFWQKYKPIGSGADRILRELTHRWRLAAFHRSNIKTQRAEPLGSQRDPPLCALSHPALRRRQLFYLFSAHSRSILRQNSPQEKSHGTEAVTTWSCFALESDRDSRRRCVSPARTATRQTDTLTRPKGSTIWTDHPASG